MRTSLRRLVSRQWTFGRAAFGPAALALLATWHPLPAQGHAVWATVPPAQNSSAPAAYDPVRGRLVTFGGTGTLARTAETWEWDGSLWQQVFPLHCPPARDQHAMAYDPARGQVVLFGGQGDNGLLADTWVYDGSDWTQRNPTQSPSARVGCGLVFDANLGRVLLFGGHGAASGSYQGDTWDWDGTTWTLRAIFGPSPRSGHAMAFDPRRARAVLLGGQNSLSGPPLGDTWEWDGSAWILRGTTGPAPRFAHALAFHPPAQRVLLFGGVAAGGVWLNDTWEWDGSTWTLRTPASPPSGLPARSLAWFPPAGHTLLAGEGLWSWNGTDWLPIVPPATHPASRMSPALAWHAGNGALILFGGATGFSHLTPLGETLAWNGSAWSTLQPAVSPGPRYGAAMVTDTTRNVCLLFGGSTFTGMSDETWEFHGTTWVQRAPAHLPPPSEGGLMAFDRGRGRAVLFTRRGAQPETWEWDGSDWTQATPATTPAARWFPALAFDAARGRTVLFGGLDDSNTLRDDTWTWDGTTWQQVVATPRPPARWQHALAYDPHRSRVVLTGGTAGTFLGPLFADTWEWDGSAWLQWQPSASYPASSRHGLAFDANNRALVQFGGYSGARDASVWRSLTPADHAARLPGCGPLLAPDGDSLPWLGDRYELALNGAVPGQPALLFVGISDQSWAGIPLPLDLQAVGMPGCALQVSIEWLFGALGDGSGVARFGVDLCSCPDLLGGVLHLQALAVSPAANPMGLLMSNSARARLGLR